MKTKKLFVLSLYTQETIFVIQNGCITRFKCWYRLMQTKKLTKEIATSIKILDFLILNSEIEMVYLNLCALYALCIKHYVLHFPFDWNSKRRNQFVFTLAKPN